MIFFCKSRHGLPPETTKIYFKPTKLYQAKSKTTSTKFWTVCQAYQKPLDPKDGFLVDGNQLNELLYKYGMGSNYKSSCNGNIVNFTDDPNFDLNMYTFLKRQVSVNKNDFQSYKDLYDFLYKYIYLNKYKTIIYGGLIDECIKILDQIIKKFCKTEGVNKFTCMRNTMLKNYYRQVYYFLLIINGDLEKFFNIIKLTGDWVDLGGFSSFSYLNEPPLNKTLFDREEVFEELVGIGYNVLSRNLLIVFTHLNNKKGIKKVLIN